MNIHLLSNSPYFVKALKEHFFNDQKISIEYFYAVKDKLHPADILIIQEPFYIKNIFFTISPIWKRFLTKYFPQTRLIIMGFCEFQSRNYIDILNLTMDFNHYLEQALPVNQNWQIPIDGMNIINWIQSFFKGHGGTSIISKLNALRQTFNIVYTELAVGSSTFEDIRNNLLLTHGVPEWKILISIWEHYYPFFEYLPFHPSFQEINEIISEISKSFSCFFPEESLLLKSNLELKLKQIHQKLLEIDKLYIHP